MVDAFQDGRAADPDCGRSRHQHFKRIFGRHYTAHPDDWLSALRGDFRHIA
jgi:hypothetical protein